ncbi:MAG: hypothetical protein PHV97_03305, partial [Candidatus Omnitrophica bacterium]|nr:hypothetical protein [Candidatus Omnitrophota bacterium]
MKITIGKKLTVGFGGALLFMFAATIFCVGTYLKTVQDYKVFTDVRVHQANVLGDLMTDFKKQTQAWKNILIRGQDPAKLVQYKEQFDREHEIVRQEVSELKTGAYRLISEENKRQLLEFEKEYQKLENEYNAALKVYTGGAGGNYREADAMVAGVDKASEEILNILADRSIETTDEMMQDQAIRAYGMGITISVVSLAVFLLGVFLTFFTIRSITRPLKALT